ncbi:MAG: SDR family NAD(P)-dependent oxidoreductase [Thalassotalea sp.]|nr:SDR family NAD(P)-dependent oxidoreductase [Thalassotalea sp.]MDG2394547.1 SDR family NAD(P)-dependent oxidoreductase [Thalassotalea sp.]
MHILITGSSSGVGRALAIKLATKDLKLSLCGRSSSKMNETLSDISNKDNVYAESFCLSETKKVKGFFLAAQNKLGDIDVLINCAGLNSSRTLASSPDYQQLDWMMKINFYAPLQLIDLTLPNMLKNRNGIILNVLSTTCLFSNPKTAQYSASKAALDSYTKVLRKELLTSGVKVLSVYPGGIDTDFRCEARPEYLNPKDVADGIENMIFTRSTVHIHELVVRPEIENNFC